MSWSRSLGKMRLTNVPVGEIDKHNERLAAGIERVRPLKLPPAGKGRAVDEQPGDGLDRVGDDERCGRHSQYAPGWRGGADGRGTSSAELTNNGKERIPIPLQVALEPQQTDGHGYPEQPHGHAVRQDRLPESDVLKLGPFLHRQHRPVAAQPMRDLEDQAEP